MNPSLIFHLVRKDIRAFRWPLALMGLAVVGMALVPMTSAGAELSYNLLLAFAGLLLLVEIQALHLDPVKSASHFLRTRPVSSLTLLLSKWVLLLMVGLLPIVLVGFVQTSRVGLGLALRDYVWLWTEALLIFVALTGMLMPLAAYLRSMGRMIGATTGGLVLLAILVCAFASRPERWLSPVNEVIRYLISHDHTPAEFCRIYMCIALVGCTGYAVTTLRYLNRRFYWSLPVVALGLWMAGLVAHFKPISLLPSDEASLAQQEQARQAVKGVKLELLQHSRVGWLEERGQFHAMFETHGLPGQYFLRDYAWSSVVHLPDGQEAASLDMRFMESSRVLESKAVTLLGFPALHGTYEWTGDWDKLAYSTLFSSPYPRPSHLSDDALQKSVLTGQCTFGVYEARIARTLPVAKGSTYVDRGVRISILDVEPTAPRALDVQTVSFDWHRPVTAYLAHQSRKEIAYCASAGGEGRRRYVGGEFVPPTVIFPAGFRISTRRQTKSYSVKARDYLDVDWSKEGQLCVFDAVRVGSFTWPFELRDMPIVSSGIPKRRSK